MRRTRTFGLETLDRREMLAVLAVGIGFSLVCDVSRAGGPIHVGYAAGSYAAGYATGSLHAARAPVPVQRPDVPWPVRPVYSPVQVPPSSSLNSVPPRHCHGNTRYYGYSRVPDVLFVPDEIGPNVDWSPGNTTTPDGSAPGYPAPFQTSANQESAPRVAKHEPAEASGTRDEAQPTEETGAASPQPSPRVETNAVAKKNRPRVTQNATGLSPEEFDRQTGKITWPKPLQGDATDDARRGLEELAATGRPISFDAVQDRNCEIRNLVEAIRQELKEQIREMRPPEYLSARKFLDGLAAELRSESVRIDLAADSH